MATYTPTAIVPITALTASAGTSVFTGVGGHTYIARTIHFETPAAKSFTMSFGADAAATRLFDAFVTTAAVPHIFNGWWVKAGSGAHDIDASLNSTAGNILVGGYDYA